jgi:hypothetical protein
MNAVFWLFLGGIGVAGASYLYKSWHSRNLDIMPDEEFLRVYSKIYADPGDVVLQQRLVIATHLGLPAERLAPDLTFERLSSYTGFAGEYEVGMGDLEDELRELFRQTSLKVTSRFPATVGDLIHEMVMAKRIIQD